MDENKDSHDELGNIAHLRQITGTTRVGEYIDATNFLDGFPQVALNKVKFYGGDGTSQIGRAGSFLSSFSNDDELHQKRQELKKVTDELERAKKENGNINEILKKQTDAYKELEEQIKISHVLSRINEKGQAEVTKSQEFLKKFADKSQCDCVVVSIDIRRSTELMLKARKPELFSEFITGLTNKLSNCILENFGVFDKFTGDGILAFFPIFYSGKDAIIRAIKASEECHKIFEEHYRLHRHSFNVFIKDVGLGIGIDFGNVTLVNTTNELTVVGIPVVYACRLSGAKAGTTVLNQGAFLEIQELCGKQISFLESEISIKNEGIAGVFMVDVNPSVYELRDPNWTTLEETEDIEDKSVTSKKTPTKSQTTKGKL